MTPDQFPAAFLNMFGLTLACKRVVFVFVLAIISARGILIISIEVVAASVTILPELANPVRASCCGRCALEGSEANPREAPEEVAGTVLGTFQMRLHPSIFLG